jgi:hypothetical protein
MKTTTIQAEFDSKIDDLFAEVEAVNALEDAKNPEAKTNREQAEKSRLARLEAGEFDQLG